MDYDAEELKKKRGRKGFKYQRRRKILKNNTKK